MYLLWQQLIACALNKIYTTNANQDWLKNMIIVAAVESFSVQEVDWGKKKKSFVF